MAVAMVDIDRGKRSKCTSQELPKNAVDEELGYLDRKNLRTTDLRTCLCQGGGFTGAAQVHFQTAESDPVGDERNGQLAAM